MDASESDVTSRIKDTDVDIVKFIDEEFDVSHQYGRHMYVAQLHMFTHVGANINWLMGLVT